MDPRWTACARDSKRLVKIILHPTASIREIREGLVGPSDDSVDLSPYVTQASHSMYDASVTLSFNREFFNDAQPKPNQILEIQLWQNGVFMPLWIGIIGAISSFTLSRGERSLQLSAKTPDSEDIWRTVKRVTPLFPQLTDLTKIAERIARTCGLIGEEILLPLTSFTTTHSNTQLAEISAWEMLTQLFIPIGWTPFMDGLGRLRRADRELQHRVADLILEDWQLVKINAQRQRPPLNRVRVQWKNPTLKKAQQTGRMLAKATMTIGWFLPVLWHKVYFSDDRTQRAKDTYIVTIHHANLLPGNYPIQQYYHQQAENEGRITLINHGFAPMAAAIIALLATTEAPISVTIPVTAFPGSPSVGFTNPGARSLETLWMGIFMAHLMMMGTGDYEIWGTPFDWVHARNTTEAFDSSVPPYIDNFQDIESDLILNEPHAQAVAVRELIYQARAANKWSVIIVDHPGLEFGDILEFPDGAQLYVEDFSRQLGRGSEATLDVSGFLMSKLGLTSTAEAVLSNESPGTESPGSP